MGCGCRAANSMEEFLDFSLPFSVLGVGGLGFVSGLGGSGFDVNIGCIGFVGFVGWRVWATDLALADIMTFFGHWPTRAAM